MINLLDLEPKKISKDLKGKYILMYGAAKVGKTTFASRIPKALIFSFEPGVNALNNIYDVTITSWREMKQYLKQLESEAVKTKFDFCVIDTVDIAYDLAEQYICAQNGVNAIGDLPYGKGYDLLKKEFASVFRKIAQLGYGLFFISHSQEKVIKNPDKTESIIIQPACPTRAKDIVNKLVDFIVYASPEWNQETNSMDRYLYLRGNEVITAGSRFRYMPDKIPFDYKVFINCLYEAIDRQIEEDGAQNYEEKENFYLSTTTIPFDTLMEKAKDIWTKITEKDSSDKTYAQLAEIIQKNFGSVVQLSTVNESQKDMLILTVEDLEEMYRNM